MQFDFKLTRPVLTVKNEHNNNNNDNDNNFKDAIKKLKKKNKRADSFSVIKILTNSVQLRLPDSGLSTKMNEMINSGKNVVKMYGGKESYYSIGITR